MKKLLFVISLIFCASSAHATRWIMYSSATATDCSGYLNGGKLVSSGTIVYCADDVGGDTSTLLSTTSAASTYLAKSSATATYLNSGSNYVASVATNASTTGGVTGGPAKAITIGVNPSSGTLAGNTFNGNSQLVQTTAGGALPALSATNLTSIPAGNLTGTVPNSTIDNSSVTKFGSSIPATAIASGSLGASVLSSSVAVNAVLDGSIVGVSASKLTGTGTLPNAAVDKSSITAQSNTFNGASQLVQLNGSTQLPAVSGVNLTNLNASNLASGTVGDTLLSSNVTLITSSPSLSGTWTFNKPVAFASTMTVTGSTIAMSGAVFTGTSIDQTTSTYTGTNTFNGTTAIKGTTTNDSTRAGDYGETTSSACIVSGNFPATGNFGDVVAVVLTPGNYMITGEIEAAANGATVTSWSVGISSNSGNSSVGLTIGQTRFSALPPVAAGSNNSGFVKPFELAIPTGSSVTYYLKITSAYSVATPLARGEITAIRKR